MDLPDAIAIIVARPFFLAVTHRVVSTLDAVVTLPFIGVTSGVSFSIPMDVLLQRLAIGMVPHAQATLSTVAPYGADNGRPIVVVRSMPPLLIGATPGGIKRIGVFLTFFPPRSETSRPFPCLDLAMPWSLTSYSRWLGVVYASARRTGARARVLQLRLSPVRPCRPRALTTRLGVAPSYFPQRESPYKGYTFAGSDDSDNPQSPACACETLVRVPVWLRSLDSSPLWGESISLPMRGFPAHQAGRLWEKS